jgi:hypothetical protein
LLTERTQYKWLKEQMAHDGTECLVWPFRRDADGYGILYVIDTLHYAHRLMCEIVHGPAPSPKHHGAHECGNGAGGCVHPKHVRWKTPAENMLDKTAHGTQSPGIRGKINFATAEKIRALRGKKTQAEIAGMFGISRSNVGYVQRKTWRTDRAASK